MPQVPHTVVQRIKEKYPKPSLDPVRLPEHGRSTEYLNYASIGLASALL